MGPSGISAGEDAVRVYTPEENQRLTENLLEVTARVHRGDMGERPPSVELLREIHRCIFTGVRGHAGKHRARDFGAEHLVFGPHRSSHRSRVEAELGALFERVRYKLRELRDNIEALNYDEEAVSFALWAHAEIIRIHPFEDGNGRSCRLLMDLLLVELSLKPIPVEACKQEYIEALNTYMLTRSMHPLLDLFLRLYVAS